MSDPRTPYLLLTKPIVNDEAGEDLWGEKLNANFDILDTNAESLSVSVDAKIEDAPRDGEQYVRQSGAWEVAVIESVDWSNIQNKPATYPPTLPIPISGVTDLQLTLNTLQGAISTNSTDIDVLESGKEPVITPGTTADYWRGDKTWQPLTTITGNFYTKTQSDARYEPIILAGTNAQFWRGDKTWQPLASITVDAYTKAQSDARFEPFDSAYTKAEADAKYLTQTAATATYEPIIATGPAGTFYANDKTWKTPAGGGSGVGLVDVSDTAPGTPVDKQLWWQSSTGILALRYNDGTSTQWVQVNGAQPNPATISTSAPSGGNDGDVWYQVP
jgi:hypothetical protein